MTSPEPIAPQATEPLALRPMRFDGERRWALALEAPPGRGDADAFVAAAEAATARAARDGAALAYGFVDALHAEDTFARLGWTSLGPAPALARPLRLSAAAARLGLPATARAILPATPLVMPFGRRRRPGVREITTKDPRVTRLWDRFSIDVGVAVERNANHVGPRIWDRPDVDYRVLIFEDGDRYVIRALCIFRTKARADGIVGHVVELLHDRSVAGMRAASHLLGLALREMSDAGAEVALAWSLVHSGSFPLFARHGFLPAARGGAARGVHVGVRAFDPALEHVVAERHRWYLSGLDFDDV
ncbi:MAG: hypothetical protein KF795_10780 [Labilithrix sp.]|nr:hypothetical protein [Labilithrix sp.]